jgi:hypothetical protein
MLEQVTCWCWVVVSFGGVGCFGGGQWWVVVVQVVLVAAVKPRIFKRKPESLYRRDSPWISGYRVQKFHK